MKNLLIFSVVFLTHLISNSQIPGSLDLTFGGTGQILLAPLAATSFENCQAVAVQSTGKTVFCGSSGVSASFEGTVGRLNVDGSLDASFATNGLYVHNNSLGSDFMYDIKVLEDDKILICGGTSLGASNTQWAIWRLTPDGALDPSFGSGGVLEVDIDGGQDYAREIAILSDGYIISGGSIPAGLTKEKIVVMKVDLNGAMVTSFGLNSGYTIFTTATLQDVEAQSAVVLPNGDIFLVGSSYSTTDNMDHGMIAMVDNNGNPITSLDGDGIWIEPGYGKYYGVAYSDGRVIACGNQNGNEYNFMLGAYLPNGILDTTFGVAGYGLYSNNIMDALFDLVVQPDGKIVTCGTTGVGGFGGTRDFCLLRFNADGTMDSSFGTNGFVVTIMGAGFEDANSLALTNDYKVVCGGFVQQTNNDFGFSRYYLGEVIVVVPGCMDDSACNYNPDANSDDSSCYFIGSPCDDGNIATINDVYNASCECAGSVTAIEQLDAPGLSLFPNPTKGILNIHHWKNGHVVVYDNQGKRVLNTQLTSNTLHVESLPAGIYRLVMDGVSTTFVKE